MKFQKEVGIFSIYSNNAVPKYIESGLKTGFEKNIKIFGRKPSKKFRIYLCDSEKEYKKHAKYYYMNNSGGTVLRDSTIVVKTETHYINEANKRARKQPKLKGKQKIAYEKEMDKWWKNYKKTLRNYMKVVMEHEMNHAFWMNRWRIVKPVWILEALASEVNLYGRLSNKEVKKQLKDKKINHKILNYGQIVRKHLAKGQGLFVYSLWKQFLLYITKNKPKKIIKFLDEYHKKPTRKNYDKLFVKYFKKDEKQIFEKFLDEL